jgi:hypothetical protein
VQEYVTHEEILDLPITEDQAGRLYAILIEHDERDYLAFMWRDTADYRFRRGDDLRDIGRWIVYKAFIWHSGLQARGTIHPPRTVEMCLDIYAVAGIVAPNSKRGVVHGG